MSFGVSDMGVTLSLSTKSVCISCFDNSEIFFIFLISYITCAAAAYTVGMNKI